ncbi:MAG: 50S ribosomal protein L25/general stress protein Ctc [Micavibrio sp.]|nr:50S ribosomal protein L25/general stress protein Ctc [Micavibrio sp.]|tara:strand:+ start:705 stop:1394 length:690 start_codon:yes stop_codon:yes gene_type:complete
MTAHIALDAAKREGTGKGIARALRRNGKVPAVIYGNKETPVSISLDANEVTKQLHKGHFFTSLCDIKIDSKNNLVLARDVQLHPVTDVVEHVDFLRVTEKTRIPVNIAVHFLNEDKSEGLEAGGVLSVARYEVEVMCAALNIPESIEIDLAGTKIGDVIKSDAVNLPKGVEFTISDRDFTIASIVEPKQAIVEDDEDEVAADEVEATEQSGDESSEGSSEGESAEKTEE